MFVFIELFLNFYLLFNLLLLSVFFFFVIRHFTCRHIFILGTMPFAFPLVSFVLSKIIACFSATHVRPAHIFPFKGHHSVFVISFISTVIIEILWLAVSRELITLIISIMTPSLRLRTWLLSPLIVVLLHSCLGVDDILLILTLLPMSKNFFVSFSLFCRGDFCAHFLCNNEVWKAQRFHLPWHPRFD